MLIKANCISNFRMATRSKLLSVLALIVLSSVIVSLFQFTRINVSDRYVLQEMIRGPLDQADDRLLDLISEKYLIPPVPKSEPYNLLEPSIDPSMGQSAVVKKIFATGSSKFYSLRHLFIAPLKQKGHRNGFFVECGALDGETRSNTLSLEKDFGWQGLLIEGSPSNFKLLRTKKRKAWLADCCLAINPYPHEAKFLQDFNVGQIVDPKGLRSNASNTAMVTKSQCFPLYSLLKAINILKVDYFSLDVEGFELEVLRTIPFDKVQIKVLSVEFIHGKGSGDEVLAFMKSKGYRVLTKVTHQRSFANDFIFINQSLPNPGTFPTEYHTAS